LLLVVDEAPAFQVDFQNKWGLLLLLWFVVSALAAPEVIDRALTAGLLAGITCIWIAMQIGKRAANTDNALLQWLLLA